MVQLSSPEAEVGDQIRVLETRMHGVCAEDVAAAVCQLQSGSNTRHADLWLQAFQKSRHAWRPLNEILTGQGVKHDLYFFAARTLAAKLKDGHSLEQLNANEQDALRLALSSHLKRFAAGPAVVRTQLCIAAGSSWALHAAALTTEEARNVMHQLGGELYDGSPVGALAFIEFLTILAEEARRVEGRDDSPAFPKSAMHEKHAPLSPVQSTPHSPPPSSSSLPFAQPRRHRGKHGNRYSTVMAARAAAPGVFSFASEQWSLGDLMLRPALLRLVSRWLVFGGQDIHNVVAPLVPLAVTGLADISFAATASDFIVEVASLATERHEDMPELLNLLALGIPDWVVFLQQLYAASEHEIQHAVTRAACALGEALCSMIASGDPRMAVLLTLLIDCTSHPDVEVVAALSYPFWARLADASEDAGSLAPHFAPQMLRLVDTLLIASRLSPEFGIDDNETDFEAWRFDNLSHAIIDILRLTGLEGAKRAWALVESARKSGDWFQIEAALFVVQHTPTDFVPRIAQEILAAEPLMSQSWRIRNSYTRLIGRCGVALGNNTGALPPGLLQYVAGGLHDERTHGEAILALWLLSTQCPCAFVDDTKFAGLVGLLAEPQLGRRHVELIAEGVGRVIAVSPVQAAVARIEELGNVVTARAVADLKRGKGDCAAWEWCILAHVVESHGLGGTSESRSAWAKVWSQLWPSLHRVLAEPFANFRPPLSWKNEAASAGVRVLRGVSVAAQDALTPHLKFVLEAVSDGLRADPQAPVFDAIAAIVEAQRCSVGSNPELISTAVEILVKVSEPLFVLCRRDGLVQHHGLVRSFFGVLAIIARDFPAATFHYSRLASTMLTTSAEVIKASDLVASVPAHCEVLQAAINCIFEVLDVSSPYSERASALLLADGGAAAYAIICACLHVIDAKANRPLEIARQAALPLAALWYMVPQCQRADLISRGLASTHIPTELCDSFQQKLLELPSTLPDRCPSCNAPPGRPVHCCACTASLPTADGIATAFESLYISAPIEAQP